MKNTIKLILVLFIFNSCGLSQNDKFCMEENDFKGVIENLVTTSKQGLRQNHYLNYSINSQSHKIRWMQFLPRSKETAREKYPINEKVKSLSDELDNYFHENMNLLVKESKGVEEFFTKNGKSQRITNNTFYTLEKLYSNKKTTELFSSKTIKSDSLGKTFNLKMQEYRNRLILLIADTVKDDRNIHHVITTEKLKTEKVFFEFLTKDKHPNKSYLMDIYSALTKPDKVIVFNEMINWNDAKFINQPFIGVISTFISLRNDIRFAQLIATNLLLSDIDMPLPGWKDMEIPEELLK